MGLFYRRPLCFFAFIFVAFSLIGFFVSIKIALLLLVGCTVFLLSLGAVSLLKKTKKRIFLFGAMLSLSVALVAVGYSILSVALPLKSAERYVGEQEVLAEVVREEYRSDDYVLYSVRLLQIGEERTKISATLSCHSAEDFAPMDRVIAMAELSAFEERNRDGALLHASIDKEMPIYLQRTSETISWQNFLRSPSGIRVLSERAQRLLRETMLSQLGERVGGLASAFFLGDRSALSEAAVRDFSRSGTSHLMAVSGLHFSILFGALDLLLRGLCCPKKGRIFFLSIGSIAFLFLTGFSMSACRAAMMLYALYFAFLIREEHDSITALFLSFSLIVFLSPYAIVDLGLWMSFLATLGILTLYPLLSEKIPRARGRAHLRKLFLNSFREALILILLTLIATLFLLPVLWLYFGEVSIVSLLANPIVSPLANLFLISIPIWLLSSRIPFLSAIVGAFLRGVASAILSVIDFFSKAPLATVSLNYAFCRVLIPLFSLAMIAVLLLRFRRKWLVFVPPILLILVFSLCFVIVRMSERVPNVEYISQRGGEEAILISDGDAAAICDMSGGSLWLYREIFARVSEMTATEIESVVLTQYHESHPSSMVYLLGTELIRTLYLPVPCDVESGAIAAELWEIATDAGSEVVFYESGRISMTEHIRADIELGQKEADAFAVTLISTSETVTYATCGWLETAGTEQIEERVAKSKTLIVGAHGDGPSEDYGALAFERGLLEKVIYSSEKSASRHRLRLDGVERYIVRKRDWSWVFPLP